MLERHPRASESEIRDEMAINLCRCGTHIRILRAVQRAGASMRRNEREGTSA
ncbi:MAG TPA: 2Fe-2S iron-sulfur cluster-binding protein [Variovorax sp.]